MTGSKHVVALASGCAGLVITAQIGGKALRDALFLSSFDVSSLPLMVMGAAVLSMVAAMSVTRLFGTQGPRRVTSAMFIASAALIVGMGLAATAFPGIVAVLLYLHLAVFGALLVSGLWSTVSEAFDPAAARQHIGSVASGATAGGLAGGVLAERVAALWGPSVMFFIIAGVHLACAVAVLQLRPIDTRPPPQSEGLRAALRAVSRDRYLVVLTAVVVIATTLENILDYLLKAEASAALDQAELMRFFGVFYTAVGLIAFIMQVAVSQRVLRRFGPAGTAGALPVTAAVSTLSVLMIPGLWAAAVARGAYAVTRNTLFRSGYELFFAPLPPARKRQAKTLIDVGSERAGDLLGSLLIGGVLLVLADDPAWLLCVLALLLTAALGFMMWELHAGYRTTLEGELIDRGGELAMTQNVMRVSMLAQSLASFGEVGMLGPSETDDVAEATRIDEVRAALADTFDSHAAIAWLGDDEVAALANEALRRDLGQHVDALCAAMSDPHTDFAVRRRIPGLLSDLPLHEVREALITGLDDRRFEVRFRCGAVLFAFVRDGAAGVDREQVHELLKSELRVGKKVWKARQSLDMAGDARDSLDEVLGRRVNRSLQHMFHLLGLVHPIKPLRVAFAGLHTDDPVLRGTALEYLATILPAPMFRRLAKLVGDEIKPSNDAGRALESLLASQESVQLALQNMPGGNGAS